MEKAVTVSLNDEETRLLFIDRRHGESSVRVLWLFGIIVFCVFSIVPQYNVCLAVWRGEWQQPPKIKN